MKTLESLISINLDFIILGLIVVFFTLEQVLGTQFKFNRRLHHLSHNFLMYAVLFVLNLFWAGVVVFTVNWFTEHQLGLLYLVEIPLWVTFLLGIAVYDLSSYWFHRAAHFLPLVWRFHRVHHSDTTMDSTTFLRGHPLETMFWFGFSAIVASAVFGLDLKTLGIYYFILIPMLFLEHANFKYPKWLDKTLGLIITTPNLHKVHHEQDEYYTNSNYADIFIFWDRLFGTFKHKPVEDITFGLQEFNAPEKQTFWYLIISPFLNIKRIPSKGKINNSCKNQLK